MLSQVIEMERIVEQGFLYDFYGVLLTAHQREIYEDVVFHDFSVSEIAREQGISRQGVHDLVRRCNQALKGYEEKLHLVEKFRLTKELAGRIQELLDRYQREKEDMLLQQARDMAGRIVDI